MILEYTITILNSVQTRCALQTLINVIHYVDSRLVQIYISMIYYVYRPYQHFTPSSLCPYNVPSNRQCSPDILHVSTDVTAETSHSGLVLC
jgi:hypothetical protein